MDEQNLPRVLSHDEKHAAEAAFSGRPFNPRWSARARVVYDGIVKSLPTPAKQDDILADPNPAVSESAMPEAASEQPEPRQGGAASGLPAAIPFQQAIDTGALIDVTPTAKQLGMTFSVTVTKPLWDTGIAPVDSMTPEEQSGRLRDVLMAFRLRLTAQPTLSPLVDFPALLALPPNTIPKPVPLLALIQPDEQNQAMVTLLLPTEVATTIIPMN
jgi:hypothetical protein